MIIIPAIDLKDEKCVRLVQGKEGTETIYHKDPVTMARILEEKGAKRIHVIDIDGAFLKRPYHTKLIGKILKSINIPIQLGGGIRTMEDIKTYLDMGVNWIILGSLALENKKRFIDICERFPAKILLAIDAKMGKVAINGWKKIADYHALSLAKEAEKIGVSGINYTDILRDGMETGPNLEGILSILKAVNIPVHAAGGISCIEDVKALLSLESDGLKGMIIGRALYTGKIDIQEAINLSEERDVK